MNRLLIEALRGHLQQQSGLPVQLVETHISWVLLTGTWAYKIKKPVKLGFVDFSTRALRKHFCEEELRLNRRFAPSLYLSVVPIRGGAPAPHIDGPGAPIDYAVCMRRFAPGALLSERVAAGSLQPEHLETFARRLARLHQEAPVAPAVPGRNATGHAVAPVLDVLRQLRGHVDGTRISALQSWVSWQAEALCETWSARQNDHHMRECHGDLHLGNVVLLDTGLTAFDCVEFEPALRQTDVLADVAFLTMDLKANARSDLASCFLDAYLEYSGDYAGLRVLRFYEVYRALVRALVTCLQGRIENDRARERPDYLALAERMVSDTGNAARLLITHGVSGSGKSTVARRLVAQAAAIRLRSDVERKRLFGLSALEPSADRHPIYTNDATARTFDRLADGARVALRAGYAVIVDAAFLRRAERDVFRAVAAELKVPFTILHCTAPEQDLRERVVTRAVSRTDPSEADVAVLEHQLRYREPLARDEQACTIDVATDLPVDVQALRERWFSHT